MAAAIITIMVGFLVAYVVPDGRWQYQGVLRSVADDAVSLVAAEYERGEKFGDLTLKVERVRPILEGEFYYGDTENWSPDPDNPRHYLAVVSHRTLFGINIRCSVVYWSEVMTCQQAEARGVNTGSAGGEVVKNQ